MKKIFSALIVLFVGVWAYSVYALPATCQITGNISQIYGLTSASTGSNVRVAFKGVNLQNPPSGSIIPGGSSCSVFTDVNGNLPTTGNCVNFLQGAIMQVTIGDGQPTQIQVPIQASADLSTLILANTDPPGLISSISVTAGGDYVLSVTNPAAGSVGQAVLAPGNVTGWAGEKIPTGVPSPGAMPYFTSTAGGQWAFSQYGSFTPVPFQYNTAIATFTPTISAVYSATPVGYWAIEGNMVYVDFTIVVNSSTNDAAQNFAVALPSGVPTPIGPGGGPTPLFWMGGGMQVNNWPTASVYQIVPRIDSGGQAIILIGSGPGQAGAALTGIQALNNGGAQALSGSIFYRWF